MPTRTLIPVTGWTNPRFRFKERMRRIREWDRRMTESRIVEEALADYVLRLETQIRPAQELPASVKSRGRA